MVSCPESEAGGAGEPSASEGGSKTPPCLPHPNPSPRWGGALAPPSPRADLVLTGGEAPPVPERPAARLAWLNLLGLSLARLVVGLVVALILLSAGLVLALRWVDPPCSAFMLGHAWNLWRLDQTPPYYAHLWIDWEEMPSSIALAAIAGEDQRFPEHLGFDLIQIRHAWLEWRSGGRLRGASTISQQTAKNLFLWPGQSWWRKALEAWFTLLLETLWPKERILEVYLNMVQFSPGTYGIEASSQRFFGHSARTLSPEEAALLIGVLPAPGRYRLDAPSPDLKRRAAWIRDQMGRLGGVRYLGSLKGD